MVSHEDFHGSLINGTEFADHKTIASRLNTPRKCLNFASSAQHFFRCLKLLQGRQLKVEFASFYLFSCTSRLNLHGASNANVRCINLKKSAGTL